MTPPKRVAASAGSASCAIEEQQMRARLRRVVPNQWMSQASTLRRSLPIGSAGSYETREYMCSVAG